MKILNFTWKMYLLFLISIFFTSCTSQIAQAPFVFKEGDIIGITSSDEVKTTYIKKHGKLDRYCAARESDAVLMSENGFSADANNPIANENVSNTSGIGALSLGGRDPIVLITRELMYRACELTMNLNLNQKDTMTTYSKFLDHLLEISKYTTDKGTKTSSGYMPTPKINTVINKVSSDDLDSDNTDDDDSDDDNTDDDDSDDDDSDDDNTDDDDSDDDNTDDDS